MAEVQGGDSYVPPIAIDFPTLRARKGWLPNPPSTIFEGRWIYDRIAARGYEEFDYPEDLRPLIYDELADFDEPVRTNLHNFAVNLYGYASAVPLERRALSLTEIWKGSLLGGPSFTKWLDGYKSYILKIECDRQYFSTEIEEEYSSFGYESKKGFTIGDIYRSNFLFNWDAPELDWIPIVTDPYEPSPGSEEAFRSTLREYLKDRKFDLVEFPKWLDFVAENAKRTIDPDSHKRIENWKRTPVFTRTRGITSIAHIPRELKEKRAAVIDEQDSATMMKWIDSCIGTVLSLDNRNAMKYHPGIIKNKLQGFLNKTEARGGAWRKQRATPRAAYCRDFKKEGLTRPRVINRIILEELHNRFPGCQAFDQLGFYDEWIVKTDEREIFTSRGTGLGTFNNGVTLMQIIIEELNVRLCGIRPSGSMYLNDDGATVFETEELAQQYASADRQTCIALDLAFKDKATFISVGSIVLCEQYVRFKDRSFGNKDSFYYTEALLGLKAVNASHARSICNCANVVNIPEYILNFVFEYWGWVLYRNEWNRPISVGGWFRSSTNGVDVSYHNKAADEQLVAEEKAANWAYEETTWDPIPWRRGKSYRKTFLSTILDKTTCEAFGIKLFNNEIDMFRRSANPFEVKRTWISFETQLRKNFKYAYHYKKHLTWRDVWYDDQASRPTVDILPPIGVGIKGYAKILGNDKDLELINPYKSVSFWKEVHQFEYNQSNKFCIRNPSDTIVLKGGDDEGNPPWLAAIKWRERHLPPGTAKYIWNLISIPNEFKHNCWINPLQVHAVVDRYTNNWGYLEISEEDLPPEKREILETRREVFGRDLTPLEWIELGKVGPRDVQILRVILKDHTFDAETEKYLIDIMLQYPGLGGILDYQPNPMKMAGYIKLWRHYHELNRTKEIHPVNPLEVEWFDPEMVIAVFKEKDPYYISDSEDSVPSKASNETYHHGSFSFADFTVSEKDFVMDYEEIVNPPSQHSQVEIDFIDFDDYDSEAYEAVSVFGDESFAGASALAVPDDLDDLF